MNMGELFLKLLNMSITASWLVLAVIAFRFFLKKAPKGLRFFLWGLVALRLVLPFSPESVLSLIPSAETVPDTVSPVGGLTVSSGFEPVDSAVNDYINIHSYAVTGSASDKGISLISVIGIIWAVGVAVMLAYSVFAYLRLKKEVAPSVRIRDNIYVCDGISSPFILGLFKPKIYLSSGLSPYEKELVIAHEQEHLKHRDHFWKPIAFALLSVYWFNPVMWVAFILLCKDIELACDERVIKNMSREEALDYSQTLLNCSSDRKRIIACPVAFGEVSVKERIKTILRYKKPAVVIVAAAVIVSVIVSVCFMTNPKKGESPLDLPSGTFVSETSTGDYGKEYMYMIIESDKKSIKFGAKDVLTGDIYDSSVEECSYKIVDGEIQIYNSVGNMMDCKIEKEEKNAIIYNGRRFERSFESLDNAVHDILLPMADAEYSELKTEGHIILDTQTSKKNESGERTIKVYLLTRLSNYNFENGCFVEQKAAINGAVIEFKHGEFGYSKLRVDYPVEGDDNFEFVKRCFPEKYLLRVLDVSEKDSNEMKKQCVSQAESYLEKIGRKAEIYDGSDFKRITFTDVGVNDEVCEKIEWFSGYDYIGNIEAFDGKERDVYKTEFDEATNTLISTEYVYDTGDVISLVKIDASNGRILWNSHDFYIYPGYFLEIYEDDHYSKELKFIPDDEYKMLTEEFFAWETEDGTVNMNRQLLTSTYTVPEDIDFFELLYNGFFGRNEVSQEELAKLEKNEFCPYTKAQRADVDAFLKETMGITIGQSNKKGLYKLIYLKEFDSYYNLHGDSNIVEPIFVGGYIDRKNNYILFYNTCNPDDFRYYDTNFVVLRKQPGGAFKVVSNFCSLYH